MQSRIVRAGGWLVPCSVLLTAAISAAACSSTPSPSPPPAQTTQVAVVSAPTASVAAPADTSPEPVAAPAPTTPPALTLPDGPQGEWTGAQGNYGSPITSVWGSGDLVLATAFNGLLRSNDRGLTWNKANVALGGKPASVWGTSPEDIYIGTANAILHSTDRGATWSRSATPVAMQDIRAFWGTGSEVYAVGQGAILRSADKGATWVQQAKDLEIHWLYGVWGSGSDVWAAGAKPPKSGSFMPGVALLHSKDSGKTWAFVDIKAAELRGVCGTEDGSLFVIGSTGGVYKSKDGGKKWADVLILGMVELYAIACVGKSEVYVGGRGGNLKRSTDGGATWTDALAAQPKDSKAEMPVVFSVFAVSGAEMYAAGDGEYSPNYTGTLLRRR